jgi:5-methylcytosine-specific restriction endonuclease McrA
MTVRDFKEYLAARSAKPVSRREIVRRLAPSKKAATGPRLNFEQSERTGERTGETEPTLNKPSDVAPRDAESEKTHWIGFAASKETMDHLSRLKDLMGTSDLDSIVKSAFATQLEKIDPIRREARREKREKTRVKKTGESAPKKPSASPRNPRKPPRALADQAFAKAMHRCDYTSPDGQRCCATKSLQVDHVRPWALNGSSLDPANLRVLCPQHNGYYARRSFNLDFRKLNPRPM